MRHSTKSVRRVALVYRRKGPMARAFKRGNPMRERGGRLLILATLRDPMNVWCQTGGREPAPSLTLRVTIDGAGVKPADRKTGRLGCDEVAWGGPHTDASRDKAAQSQGGEMVTMLRIAQRAAVDSLCRCSDQGLVGILSTCFCTWLILLRLMAPRVTPVMPVASVLTVTMSGPM